MKINNFIEQHGERIVTFLYLGLGIFFIFNGLR